MKDLGLHYIVLVVQLLFQNLKLLWMQGLTKMLLNYLLFLKFKLKEKFKERGYASILVWTTTPWTLPGNLALAINRKISYVLIEY